MYIKILIYIIDNQQFKWEISIPFWLAGVCRSFFPPFVDWGGRSKKTADPTARFRGGGPSRISPSHHTPPHLSNNVPHTPNNTLILPITSRISSSPNIPHTSSQPYHPPSHLICYICDIIKT